MQASWGTLHSACGAGPRKGEDPALALLGRPNRVARLAWTYSLCFFYFKMAFYFDWFPIKIYSIFLKMFDNFEEVDKILENVLRTSKMFMNL